MLHNEQIHSLYRSPNIVRMIKSRRLRWADHVTRMEEYRSHSGGVDITRLLYSVSSLDNGLLLPCLTTVLIESQWWSGYYPPTIQCL